MIGESKRNIPRNKQLHGTVAVACFGMVLALAACSDDGDDLVFEDASVDAARVDAARDAGRDVAATDVSAADVSADRATVDQRAPEASTDAARDGGIDARADAPPTDARVDAPVDGSRTDADAAGDAGNDAARPDATTTDAPADSAIEAAAAAEAEAAAPPMPLQMCTMLDSAWGIGSDAAACATSSPDTCPDRGSNWGNDIVFAFGALGELGTDCRIRAMLPTGTDSQQYTSDVAAWTLKFFGCPNPDDATSPFGLIPSTQSGHVFTTADLELLSELYVTAINQAIAEPDNGTGPLTPLTTTQLNQIRAELARRAATVPNTVTSTTYSFSTCPADAGTDGGSD